MAQGRDSDCRMPPMSPHRSCRDPLCAREGEPIFLDACVLFPIVVRRIVLGAARAGLFRPLWSRRVLDEWQIAIARRHGAAAEDDVILIEGAEDIAGDLSGLSELARAEREAEALETDSHSADYDSAVTTTPTAAAMATSASTTAATTTRRGGMARPPRFE